jgi:hypothetical protein
VTSQQPENSTSADTEIPDTEVIAVPAPAPVFVDSTGRRSRLLRRLAYAFGVIVMIYGGLIAVSLAGGPVRSSAVLPLPGLDLDPKESKPPARPSPSPSPSIKSLFVTEALPRRTATRQASSSRIESTTVTKKPTPKATPTKTPTPSATTSHPVESTTTPAPSASSTPPTTGTTTTPPTIPPVPPAEDTGSGGQGGGSTVSDDGDSGPTGSGSVGESSPTGEGTASPRASTRAGA